MAKQNNLFWGLQTHEERRLEGKTGKRHKGSDRGPDSTNAGISLIIPLIKQLKYCFIIHSLLIYRKAVKETCSGNFNSFTRSAIIEMQ